MNAWTWFCWWFFGSRIVRCCVYARPGPFVLHRTPTGIPYVGAPTGPAYMIDEPGTWPKIDELAPAQPPLWRRLRKKDRDTQALIRALRLTLPISPLQPPRPRA